MSDNHLSADVALSTKRVQHHGTGGELFGIFIVNLLLTIITLGIYRFWATTRMRQYLWTHTNIDGESMEYTGTGLELFLGVLKAVGIFLLLALVLIGVPVFLAEQFGEENPILAMVFMLPMIAYAVILILLLLAAPYWARGYKLSRTRWRGIRFAQTGSGFKYAWRTIGYGLLSLLTLYLCVPLMRNRLYAYAMNNTYFGGKAFEYTGTTKPLFSAFIKVLLGNIVLFAVLALIIFGMMDVQALEAGQPPAGGQLVIMGVLYLVAIIGSLYLGMSYFVTEMKHFAAHTRYEGLRFSSSARTGSLFAMLVTDLLLLIFTLGLAMPWVIVRSARYFADHFEIQGQLDYNAIKQSEQELPKGGEGFAEALGTDGF